MPTPRLHLIDRRKPGGVRITNDVHTDPARDADRARQLPLRFREHGASICANDREWQAPMLLW